MDIKGILNQSWSTWPRWFAWMSHLHMDVGRECHWWPGEPHTSPRALRFFLFVLDILSFKFKRIMAVFFGIIPFSILVNYDSSFATHCLLAAWKGSSSLVFFLLSLGKFSFYTIIVTKMIFKQNSTREGVCIGLREKVPTELGAEWNFSLLWSLDK